MKEEDKLKLTDYRCRQINGSYARCLFANVSDCLRVFLIVERESQVGIVVGKGGEKIKEIRQAAQKELGKVFSQRIHLDLRCKADPKWRTKDHLIQSILGSSQPKE